MHALKNVDFVVQDERAAFAQSKLISALKFYYKYIRYFVGTRSLINYKT